MFILGLSDNMYMGQYYLYVHHWLSGMICSCVKFTTQVISDMNIFLAVHILLEKIRGVTRVKKSSNGIEILHVVPGLVMLLLVCGVALMTSTSFVVDSRTDNGACLGWLIDTEYNTFGFWYSIGHFWIFKSCLHVILWALSFYVYLHVRARARNTGRVSGGSSNIQLAMMLLPFAVTNTGPWITELCLIITDMHTVPTNLLAMVCLHHTHAVLNPFLHTFFTKQFQMWLKERKI